MRPQQRRFMYVPAAWPRRIKIRRFVKQCVRSSVHASVADDRLCYPCRAASFSAAPPRNRATPMEMDRLAWARQGDSSSGPLFWDRPVAGLADAANQPVRAEVRLPQAHMNETQEKCSCRSPPGGRRRFLSAAQHGAPPEGSLARRKRSISTPHQPGSAQASPRLGPSSVGTLRSHAACDGTSALPPRCSLVLVSEHGNADSQTDDRLRDGCSGTGKR